MICAKFVKPSQECRASLLPLCSDTWAAPSSRSKASGTCFLPIPALLASLPHSREPNVEENMSHTDSPSSHGIFQCCYKNATFQNTSPIPFMAPLGSQRDPRKACQCSHTSAHSPATKPVCFLCRLPGMFQGWGEERRSGRGQGSFMDVHVQPRFIQLSAHESPSQRGSPGPPNGPRYSLAPAPAPPFHGPRHPLVFLN